LDPLASFADVVGRRLPGTYKVANCLVNLVRTQIGSSSPARDNLASSSASRVSFFTRSPDCFGMRDGAITWLDWPSRSKCRCRL
jgi:hypothetical protein